MRQWKMRPEDKASDEFIEACLRLWDMGMDTDAISDVVWQDECVVERAVRLGRERRREKEKQNEEWKP
jgi:hypothetical protein